MTIARSRRRSGCSAAAPSYRASSASIQTEDDAAGEGLLSSLVVGSTSRIPGRGYFEHARQKLKRSIGTDPDAERGFWSTELAKLGVPTPPEPRDEGLAPSEQIRAALVRRLPSLADAFTDADVERLVEAWSRGPAMYSTIHPAIEILLGEQLSFELLAMLDHGLGRIRDAGADLRPTLDRLLDPSDFRLARGAANELWAAAHLTQAGGHVTFEDPTAPEKKPDLRVEYEGESATFEVVSVGGAHDAEKENNKLSHAFQSWPKGKSVPKTLLGHARDHGGGVRMLEMGVSVLKAGPLATKIDALTNLKDSSQLKRCPCPVLVIFARHQWGFFSADCAPVRTIKGAKYTGIAFAATYGRHGDYVFDGEEFRGRGYEMSTQRQDGMLRKSKTIAAVVFLLQSGKGVVFENLQEGCGFSSRTLAHFVRRAFDADPELSVFKVGR